MVQDGSTLLPDTIEAVQKLLDEQGVCALAGVLDPGVINSCHKEFLQSWQVGSCTTQCLLHHALAAAPR